MSDQPLDRDRITKPVSTIFAGDLHAKRVASLAGAAVGVLEGAASSPSWPSSENSSGGTPSFVMSFGLI